ncbi:MAG: hypothetical protein K6T68_10415 [Alicyclobacillus shizuokensis]|nr:hypothetical protein [Alicyclobacillus shizuokensis]
MTDSFPDSSSIERTAQAQNASRLFERVFTGLVWPGCLDDGPIRPW